MTGFMKLGVIAAAAAFCAGCATGPSAEMRDRQMAEASQSDVDRLVQRRLLEAAASIDGTLKLIERIERGTDQGAGATSAAPGASEPAAAPAVASAPAVDPLSAKLRIVWKNGPADELLAKLAEQLGMGFKVSGAKKPLPMVSVDVNGTSARSVLEQVGRQIDRNADIVVSRASTPAVLELRYK